MTRLQALLCDTLRDHLASGQPARVPEGCRMIWNAFAALSEARQWHTHGPQAISFPEVEAWARTHRTPLEAHHVDAIRAMDQVWLADARKDKPAAPAANFTEDVFDAMFG